MPGTEFFMMSKTDNFKIFILGQAQWLTPVNSVFGEAEVSGSHEVRSSRPT